MTTEWEMQTYRSVGGTGQAGLLCRFPGLVFSQSCLQLGRRLELGLLGTCCTLSSRAGSRVSCGGTAIGLGGKELVADALIVLLQNIVGDTLHAKDFNVRRRAIGQSVLHRSQILLVNLVHMDGQTYCILAMLKSRTAGNTHLQPCSVCGHICHIYNA